MSGPDDSASAGPGSPADRCDGEPVYAGPADAGVGASSAGPSASPQGFQDDERTRAPAGGGPAPGGAPSGVGTPPGGDLSPRLGRAPSGLASITPAPPPAPPPAAKIDVEPRWGPVRNAAVLATTTVGLFLLSVLSDALGNILSDLRYVLGVGGLFTLLWLTRRVLERSRNRYRDLDSDLVAPGPPLRPAWFRTPEPLAGRDGDRYRGLDIVCRHGLLAVTGLPGIGSSAVAEAVVADLVERGLVDAADTAPFDLRGWSTRSPDDAPTIAGRLLSMFGAAEPASAEPEILADAARRLREELARRPSVLFLDNVLDATQVSWLVDEWTADGSYPYLVVAGRPSIAAAFPSDCVVELTDLDVSDMRTVWLTERPHYDGEPQDPDWLDDVLAACGGRPGAVRDLAREMARPESHWTPTELTTGLWHHTMSDQDPRERVWLTVLERTSASMSRKARQLARALADLPVAELTVEAMEAARRGIDALDAMETAGPQRYELASLTPPDRDDDIHLVDPIQELCGRSIVRRSPVGRYRMPLEVRQAVRATEPPAERMIAVRAALSSLVHRYADLATRWSSLLDSVDYARSAALWFQAEEPLLRALLTASYADTPTEDYPEGELLALTLDDLARLADAVDVWYVRQQQVFGARLVHENLVKLAYTAGRHDLDRLAAIRMAAVYRSAGMFDDAAAMLRQAGVPMPAERWSWLPWRRRTAWDLGAWHHHEQALLHLARAERTTDPTAAAVELTGAELELQRVWQRLPRKNVKGEVTTLLTMGVVYLHQGRPDRALDRLDLAESRADECGDAAGQAHAAELRGVAAWMQGRATVAAALWQHALTEFRKLSDHQGEGRCLQHLGSAVLVAPELAGLLLGDDRRTVTEVTAVQHAHVWLELSKRLRAGHPASPVADGYLRLARSRAGRSHSLHDPDVAGSEPAGREPARRRDDSAVVRLIRRVRRWWGP
jgi:tetratricopeptide (TPR) repeat protein